MTDLSGRVSSLESAYAYLTQQLLTKIDIIASSAASAGYNNQLSSLNDEGNAIESRTAVLESKSINQSIELFNLKARVGSGQVSGLYVEGNLLKNNVYLSGKNAFRVTSSGQTIYFDPGVTRSFSIVSPQVNDDFTIYYNNGPSTSLQSVYSIVDSAGGPSVSWNLYTDSNRSSTGNAISIGGFFSDSNNTGVYHTLDNYSIPSGYFLWVTVTGVQGTVNELFSRITFS